MKKIGLLTLAAALAFGGQLFGQPAQGRGFRDYFKKLNLTEQQKKDVDKIHSEMQKKQIDQRAKIQTARVDLEQLLKADNPDRSAIEKKLNQISDLEVGLHMNMVDTWFDINKLLSPEQQKTWKGVLLAGMDMRYRMMEHHNMGRGMMKDRKMSKGPMNIPDPSTQSVPPPPGEPSSK